MRTLGSNSLRLEIPRHNFNCVSKRRSFRYHRYNIRFSFIISRHFPASVLPEMDAGCYVSTLARDYRGGGASVQGFIYLGNFRHINYRIMNISGNRKNSDFGRISFPCITVA